MIYAILTIVVLAVIGVGFALIFRNNPKILDQAAKAGDQAVDAAKKAEQAAKDKLNQG